MTNAIETKYNGYNFRSRLEARWAVFFDKINVSYQYELEGFELHYNGRYLPDFFLPKYDVWFEVKPNFDGDLLDNTDIFSKAIELAMINKGVVVVCGDPLEYSVFFICPGGFCVTNAYKKTTKMEVNYLSFEHQSHLALAEYNPHTKEAKKAREARFEFGETPQLESGISPTILKEQWSKISTALGKRNSMLQGLLNASQLTEINGNKITFSFPSELLTKRINRYKTILVCELTKILGIDVEIDLVVGITENGNTETKYNIDEITFFMLENFRKANFCPSVIQPKNIEFLKDLETSFEIYDSLTRSQFKWLAKYYSVAQKRGEVPDINLDDF